MGWQGKSESAILSGGVVNDGMHHDKEADNIYSRILPTLVVNTVLVRTLLVGRIT